MVLLNILRIQRIRRSALKRSSELRKQRAIYISKNEETNHYDLIMIRLTLTGDTNIKRAFLSTWDNTCIYIGSQTLNAFYFKSRKDAIFRF
jgi:hypothetical protein